MIIYVYWRGHSHTEAPLQIKRYVEPSSPPQIFNDLQRAWGRDIWPQTMVSANYRHLQVLRSCHTCERGAANCKSRVTQCLDVTRKSCCKTCQVYTFNLIKLRFYTPVRSCKSLFKITGGISWGLVSSEATGCGAAYGKVQKWPPKEHWAHLL